MVRRGAPSWCWASRPARSSGRASPGCSNGWPTDRCARRGAPKLAFLISAIGASFFLSQLPGKLFNRLNNNNFPTYFDFRTSTSINMGGVTISLIQAIIIVSALVMMLFLDRLVKRTKLGRSIRGVAEDAPTAALMGINIDKTISRTFVIGGALGGAAGFLFGTAFGLLQHDGLHPRRQGVRGGGARRYRQHPWRHAGWPAARRGHGPDHALYSSSDRVEWTDVIGFVVLVLVLVVRPTGILGERLGRAA